MATLRLFIAIELTDQVKQALADLQATLRRQLPPKVVRWTNPEGVHLTVKFLGDTPANQVMPIAQALERAATSSYPFEVAVGGFGYFPNARRPNVLWVGVTPVPNELANLQRAVELEMAELGYAKDARAFSPHLTLGRVNKPISQAEQQALSQLIAAVEVGQLGIVPVHEVVLYKSELLPGGAVYTALAKASVSALPDEPSAQAS